MAQFLAKKLTGGTGAIAISQQGWLQRLILAFCLLVPMLSGFFDLDQQSLIAHDEGLYATRAREMLIQEDWIHPWDRPHHKTPGAYWLLAVMLRFLGTTEVAVRLPSVIASLICAVLLYEVARELLNPRVALWSVLVLNTSFIWIQYSRFATPDVAFVGLMLGCLLCLLKAEAVPSRGKSLRFMAGVILSLAFLLRSFLVVLPIAAILPYLLLENRRHRHLNSLRLYLGMGVGLVPTLLWVWACWQRGNLEIVQTLAGFLVHKTTEDGDYLSNIFFYPISIAMNSLPWWIFSLLGLGVLFKRPHSRQQRLLLGAATLLVCVLLSMASNKYHHYALVIYPGLAMLAGMGIDWLCRSRSRWSSQTVGKLTIVFGGLGGVLVIAGAVLGIWVGRNETLRTVMPYLPSAVTLGVIWLVSTVLWFGFKRRSGWFAGLLLANWLALSVAGASGLLGNANPALKAFLQQREVHTIVANHVIYFTPLRSKLSVLMRFYTPHPGPQVDGLESVPEAGYAWVWEDSVGNMQIPHTVIDQFEEVYLIQVGSRAPSHSTGAG